MIRKIIALLFFSLGFATIFAQSDKMRIVVFDLTPKSQEITADSAMLSEMLRNEFIKTGRFEVVSREQTTRIMSEAEFQSSGFSSEAGAIQIGKLLNVKRAIVGSVGTLGGTVFVTVQLFDLESGRFLTAESMEAPTMRDIVSRMKNTVAILTTAAYKAEVGTAQPEPLPTAQVKPITEKQKPEKAPRLPGEKYKPSVLNWIGYGTALAGLGSLAVGYFVIDKQVADAYQKALDAKTAYDGAVSGANFDLLWSNFTTNRDAANTLSTTRLICYIGGGVLTAGGIVLAILPTSRRVQAMLDQGWQVAMGPNAVLLSFHY